MKKTLLKLFLLVSAFMCGLGAWADDYTITGSEGTDYTIDKTTGDITILSSGLTVSGKLSGNLIIENSMPGVDITVNFKDVETLSNNNHWNSSVKIHNTGEEWPHIYLNFSGTNAFVNSLSSGFVINSETDSKPCYVYFNTDGQSVFYFGANSSTSSEKALTIGDGSHVRFNNNAKADCAQYYDATISYGQTPDWVDMSFGTQTSTTNFESYFTSYKFVKFTMNPKSDTRTNSAWITACYPYNETVTYGEVYEVYGRVMYTADDIDVSGTAAKYKAGDLKHLILKKRDDAHKNKVDAGKAYFVRKTDNERTSVVFTIDDGNNTYTEPIKVSGYVGTYETTKKMEVGSYFLYGAQMLYVGNEYDAYVDCNRAYFPYVSEDDNFVKNVDEYIITSHTGDYYVYERATGTGGNTTSQKTVKVIDSDGILLVQDEEATAIMNPTSDNNVVSSEYYDLQGRKVKTPKKGGLYIVNGKKVLY